ncbi:MAG: small multi-drug export protein, partial [Clostridia bacterium]
MDAIILASMTENIINFFRNLIGNDVITIILVSMIPIVELRGAIPMAIQMGIPPFLSFLYSYLGCAIVIPILLLILKPIINWMKRTRGFKTFALAVEGVFQGKVDKMEKNAAKSEVTLSSDDLDLSGEKSKRASKLEIKKLIAVGVFVALPIPMTGVWTGSAIAAFMGLTFWKSFAVIMLGNVVAGSIILLLSVFLKPYLDTILFWFFMLVLLV